MGSGIAGTRSRITDSCLDDLLLVSNIVGDGYLLSRRVD